MREKTLNMKFQPDRITSRPRVMTMKFRQMTDLAEFEGRGTGPKCYLIWLKLHI